MARQMFRENSSVPSALRMHGERVTRQMFMATKANGGTTVDLGTFKVPAKTDGYFVGSAKGWNGESIETVILKDEDFTLATFRQTFGKLYADYLTVDELESGKPLDGHYIGVWADSGLVYVDAVDWTADYGQAVQWAVERGELAIYDVAANGSLDIASIRVENGIAA